MSLGQRRDSQDAAFRASAAPGATDDGGSLAAGRSDGKDSARFFLSPAELQLQLRLPAREWAVCRWLMDNLDARLVEEDDGYWMRRSRPRELREVAGAD